LIVIAIGNFLYDYLKEEEYSGDEQLVSTGTPGKPEKAPDFAVLDSDGKTVHLSDMRGRPTVINFWASWCPPCREEMPNFNRVYAEMKEDVNFMMVDLTNEGETVDDARNFIASGNLDLPVFFDVDGEGSDRYEIEYIPTSVFVDSKGNMISIAVGGIDEATLRKGIANILDSK
jgi:thiol-disulfide isomerase/thioredoxin